MKWLALVLGILAVLAGIAAIIYYTVPAHSLPSMLGAVPCPVKHPHCSVHRVKRGEAAAVGAVILAVAAALVFFVGRRMDDSGQSAGARLMGN